MSTQPVSTPDKLADTVPAVHELIRKRWSPRAFSSQAVSDEDLLALLEAGRWAASSYNEQPWRFIVARRHDGELYDKLLSVLWPSIRIGPSKLRC